MTYIGVDPGLSGAIAVYENLPAIVSYSLEPGSLNFAYTLQLFDMPAKPSTVKGRRLVDGATLAFLLDNFVVGEAVAIVEDVSSMPRDGVVQAFSFGRNLGILLGVLEAKGIKILLTKPAVWKSMLGLSSDKSRSIAKAVHTFPAHAASFGRKKDDGRAEAALLAYLGATRLCSAPTAAKPVTT